MNVRSRLVVLVTCGLLIVVAAGRVLPEDKVPATLTPAMARFLKPQAWERDGDLPVLSLGEKGRWVLGRALDADILIGSDDAVSRRHAEIAVRAGVCQIRDLDSCNGTLLNGRPIDRARLKRGDIVVIGETELRVR